MTPRRKIALASAVLVFFHLAVLLAGFLAPYDPAAQSRTLPYAPPTTIHFFDAEGQFNLRPRRRRHPHR